MDMGHSFPMSSQKQEATVMMEIVRSHPQVLSCVTVSMITVSMASMKNPSFPTSRGTTMETVMDMVVPRKQTAVLSQPIMFPQQATVTMEIVLLLQT